MYNENDYINGWCWGERATWGLISALSLGAIGGLPILMVLFCVILMTPIEMAIVVAGSI